MECSARVAKSRLLWIVSVIVIFVTFTPDVVGIILACANLGHKIQA